MLTDYPFSFKAAVLERNDAPLVLDDVTFEGPLQSGHVLVRILYSGICGKQIEEIKGSAGPDAFLPHMLGHEGSGIVIDVGPDVKTVSPGDHVVLHWMKGAGIDAETPYYTRNGERVNAGWITTFNEYGVISENRVTAIPADSNMRTACLLGCAVSTGVGVAINVAKLTPNDSVAVFGCGGVGLNVLQGAALLEASPIIAVDRDPTALTRAREFGATDTVQAGVEDVAERVRELTDGRGASHVFVTATAPDAMEMATEAAATPSLVYLLGVPALGTRISLDALAIHRSRTLTGSAGGDIVPERDIPKYLRFYDEGRILMDELVVEEVALEQINDGLERVMAGGVGGRIIVGMGHG